MYLRMLKCSACNHISLLATKPFMQHVRLSAVLCVINDNHLKCFFEKYTSCHYWEILKDCHKSWLLLEPNCFLLCTCMLHKVSSFPKTSTIIIIKSKLQTDIWSIWFEVLLKLHNRMKTEVWNQTFTWQNLKW